MLGAENLDLTIAESLVTRGRPGLTPAAISAVSGGGGAETGRFETTLVAW